MEPVTDWNPLHSPSEPQAHWSTSNFGEAMPGVLTPLGWSVWGDAGERALRDALYSAGALSSAERALPEDPTERAISIFYGRVAGRVDFLFRIGDRMPGTSGAAVAEQIVGFVPEGLESRPSKRRYPIVAARFPMTFLSISGQLRRAQAETYAWWQEEVARSAQLELDQALRQLADGADRFAANVRLQGIHVMCAIQPVYDALVKVVGKSGVGEVTSFMGGYGSHAETEVVGDLWRAAKGTLSLDEVVRRHGYHGPREGEVSGLVWREDDSPLRALLKAYGDLDNDQSPLVIEESRRQERLELERELLAATGVAGRLPARFVLRLGASIIPLRGVGKASFLQSIDVTRAAARRVGELLVADGVLAEREDVFFLTRSELVGAMPERPKELVARRREAFDSYEDLELPAHWQGMPTPTTPSTSNIATTTESRPERICGVGASPGVVEGEVCVVDDPAMVDVQPGQILVARTTDPSWAPIMFVSKALVVDIGGPISHAAVVARELGIPCVVNTKIGSRSLRTGDYCRVDGAAGTVEVLRQNELARNLQGGRHG